jgi:hypothetical protein
VSNLQKRISDPWGSSDISALLSRICKLENLDPNLLLAQGASKVDGNRQDPIRSMFDARTGMWKEAMVRAEDLERRRTGSFGTLFEEPRDNTLAIDEETQYIGELNVSSISYHLYVT